MKTGGLFERLRAAVDELKRVKRIGKLDLGVLRTMMMLAAVDGDISDGEIAAFKEMASGCQGYSPESFPELFESTLRSAGYLLVLSRFRSRDELIAAFVREAYAPFVVPIAKEADEERRCAIGCLERMALSDGLFSPIERDCIVALSKEVEAEHDLSAAALRAMAADCGPLTPTM